jgi:hypothetical protein
VHKAPVEQTDHKAQQAQVHKAFKAQLAQAPKAQQVPKEL